ncbi:MAG: sigma-70 family RNA polymerase sigma factor [Saprospiraceae bacterium]
MARILDNFLNRNTNKACHQFPDAQALVAALKEENAMAIRCLSSQIAGSVYRIGKNFNLVDDDIEEIHCDCIMILVDKIREGTYEYTGNKPATYAIEIAKRRVFHYARKADHHTTDDLNLRPDTADEPNSEAMEQLEMLKKLEEFMAQLSEKCQKLIRMKYIEELKDKDVIEQGISQYTTVNALKTHRSQCMKKLVELAEQYRLQN